jgi:hypothetical protein
MDKNGWIDYDVLPDGFIGEDLNFFEVEEDDDVFVMLTRPKSLRGIEHNNGWTNIESENDLPNKTETNFHVAKDERVFNSPVNYSTVKKWWYSNKITHYKMIKKPKPPLHN